jgi:NAD(P)-dependent dehydrogenase (short-subunit alcohol dehydrogenase family)
MRSGSNSAAPGSSSLFVEKQIVVITGGSRGLGLAMAREFARDGAQLALLARDGEELQRAAADLLRFEVQVSTWPCDVLEARQVERTFSSIAEKYGRIDVLVNKAGIMLVAPLEAMAKEDFEEAMQVHFWAPYHVTMAALPYLKRNPESRIVNISSIGGRVAVPHMAPYCTSKFALGGFLRCASDGSRWARRARDDRFAWADADGFACERQLQR